MNDKQTHSDQELMTLLRESYPVERKKALKKRLDRIELRPVRRPWYSLGGSAALPRLAGVMAVCVIVVAVFMLFNTPDTSPPQEAIVKQQQPNIPPVTVNGITYLWAAGEVPTVPDTVPTYKYERTSIQTVSEMERVAEAMGATNPEHYNSDVILFMHNDGELPMSEFRGENGLTVLFTPFADSGTSFSHVPSFAEIVRTTQLANDPLPFEQQKEQISAIVDGRLTTPYLIEPNGEHIGTLSPVVDIEGVDASAPIYDHGFSPLSQFVFDENGEVALIWWRSIDIETTGETSILPPLDALSVANRHQTKWEVGTDDTVIYRESEPQVGDAITLIGTATTSVHAENGTIEAVFHPTDISQFFHLQKAYLLRGEALKDMPSFSAGVYGEVNGVVRVDNDGTEYIDVVDWKFTTLNPNRRRCREGIVEQAGRSAVFTTDKFAFSSTQSGFEAGTYRLPDFPSSVNEGERIAVCAEAEAWSEETVDWKLFMLMINTETPPNERTITSVRLTYQLGDKFTENKLTPYWEFRVENIPGHPFTIMVRADDL